MKIKNDFADGICQNGVKQAEQIKTGNVYSDFIRNGKNLQVNADTAESAYRGNKRQRCIARKVAAAFGDL